MFKNIKDRMLLKKAYLNKKIPLEDINDPDKGYHDDFKSPVTLGKTNNLKWVAYIPNLDMTIVTDKKTDIIKKIYLGKVA